MPGLAEAQLAPSKPEEEGEEATSSDGSLSDEIGGTTCGGEVGAGQGAAASAGAG